MMNTGRDSSRTPSPGILTILGAAVLVGLLGGLRMP